MPYQAAIIANATSMAIAMVNTTANSTAGATGDSCSCFWDSIIGSIPLSARLFLLSMGVYFSIMIPFMMNCAGQDDVLVDILSKPREEQYPYMVKLAKHSIARGNLMRDVADINGYQGSTEEKFLRIKDEDDLIQFERETFPGREGPPTIEEEEKGRRIPKSNRIVKESDGWKEDGSNMGKLEEAGGEDGAVPSRWRAFVSKFAERLAESDCQ